MAVNRPRFAEDPVPGKEDRRERQSGEKFQLIEAQVAVRAQETDAQPNYPLLCI